ncbi:hypothetical protein STSO111631_09890 [Stackebrandtia soli]
MGVCLEFIEGQQTLKVKSASGGNLRSEMSGCAGSVRVGGQGSVISLRCARSKDYRTEPPPARTRARVRVSLSGCRGRTSPIHRVRAHRDEMTDWPELRLQRAQTGVKSPPSVLAIVDYRYSTKVQQPPCPRLYFIDQHDRCDLGIDLLWTMRPVLAVWGSGVRVPSAPPGKERLACIRPTALSSTVPLNRRAGHSPAGFGIGHHQNAGPQDHPAMPTTWMDCRDGGSFRRRRRDFVWRCSGEDADSEAGRRTTLRVDRRRLFLCGVLPARPRPSVLRCSWSGGWFARRTAWGWSTSWATRRATAMQVADVGLVVHCAEGVLRKP